MNANDEHLSAVTTGATIARFVTAALLAGLPLAILLSRSWVVFWVVLLFTGLLGVLCGNRFLVRVADSMLWQLVRTWARHWMP